ncbi:MAG: hypothetical protein ABL886_01125 [Rhodoglobus sp.]
MNQESPQPDRSEQDIQRDLRELELVDRVMGLEAENARLAALFVKPVGPRFGYHRMLDDVWSSRTWRAGRVVLAPVRAARAIAKKLSGSQ